MDIRGDCLVEIYTGESENFNVGKLYCQNAHAAIFYDIDTQGKIAGYCAMRKPYIASLEYTTEYLEKIEKYMAYGEEHPYSKWFQISKVMFDTEKDLFDQVLEYSQKKGLIITLALQNEEEGEAARIETMEGGMASLSCVDVSNARFREKRMVCVQDIVYIGFETIDNRLLAYAERS